MRILHIMAGRGQGGAETYCADVILRLHQAGIDQCVVMPAAAPRFAELQKAGVRLAPQVLAIPFRPLQSFLLRRLIRRENPELVQCWMRRAASLVAEQKGLPVIGWFGGYYNPRYFQNCTYFVGVTSDIVQHMVKCGVDAGRATTISTFPTIETTPPIDRATLTTPREAKVLLTLSRLHPKKGLDIFLTALKSFPDTYAWLAGDGPLRQELETQARELGIIDRVRFLGWRTDRAALLRAADICVLPSRYEPFGTVILEAWAASTPLVAARSAGPSAHVEDGKNGMLVPIDDAPALANAMRRILKDEELRKRLVAQGYTTYIKNYTPEAVTQKWIQLYKELISKSAKSKAAA